MKQKVVIIRNKNGTYYMKQKQLLYETKKSSYMKQKWYLFMKQKQFLYETIILCII